jgi:uncharacterized OB-fold protein
MSNNNSKKPDRDRSRAKKGLDYSRCGKHGTTYPKGSTCPQCEAEARGKQ